MTDTAAVTAEAIVRAGGPRAVARALNVDHSAVIGWRRRGRIPVEHLQDMARLSGIAPADLRPDLAAALADVRP